MTENRNIFDLNELLSDLKRTGLYPELAEAIRSYGSCSSALFDLEIAQKAILALSKVDASCAEPEKGVLGGALFTQGIVSYCRAVVSNADARDRIDITATYNDEQEAIHYAIGALRNSVIAHHGNGRGAFGIDWRRDKVLLYERDGVVLDIEEITSTPNYLGHVASKLHANLQVAIPYVEFMREATRKNLSSVVERLQGEDPAFMVLLKEFGFDAKACFRSAEKPDAFVEARWRSLSSKRR